MAQVLHQSQSPSHFSSPQSSCSSPTSTSTICFVNDGTHQLQQQQQQHSIVGGAQEEESCREVRDEELSLLALLVAAFRKSLIGCGDISNKELFPMEIGYPSNVRHVAHVTFDRFNGFLGLPAEFEPEVPRRPPSASANVFGVSTESMQLSFDSRGNTVPTILLLMQRRLYELGGLQAEGIFRINADNSQEEYVREQLNRGVVPEDVDVHCLGGLIKAWFRELPTGVLDALSPEQVMQSETEEEYVKLARLLPPTEADLLDWAINLMADVAQLEHVNKMNARNIAMVFAPNMTKMEDPLTALMYAVQVMNFLKTLIVKTLREREDSVLDTAPPLHPDPSDESDHRSSLGSVIENFYEDCEPEETFITEEPSILSPTHSIQNESATETGYQSYFSPSKYILSRRNQPLVDNHTNEADFHVMSSSNDQKQGDTVGLTDESQTNIPVRKNKIERPNDSYFMNGITKKRSVRFHAAVPTEKGKGTGIITRINSRTELAEAWR